LLAAGGSRDEQDCRNGRAVSQKHRNTIARSFRQGKGRLSKGLEVYLSVMQYHRRMECKLTVSVVEEGVEGDIGDDWEYTVTATVIDPNGRSLEAGRIRVPEHHLKPGTTQPPPSAAGVKIRAGACGAFPKVELRLDVNEVDWLVDDPGTTTVMIPIDCPGQGKPAFSKEVAMSVEVRERPKALGGKATFKLTLRLATVCL